MDGEIWQRVGDATEAAAVVERLRNADAVDEARIYRLEELPFEFRQYYRVELAQPAVPASFAARIAPDPDPEPEVEPEPEPIAPVADSEPQGVWPSVAVAPDIDAPMEHVGAIDMHATPEPSTNGSGARRGLFGR